MLAIGIEDFDSISKPANQALDIKQFLLSIDNFKYFMFISYYV